MSSQKQLSHWQKVKLHHKTGLREKQIQAHLLGKEQPKPETKKEKQLSSTTKSDTKKFHTTEKKSSSSLKKSKSKRQ